MRSDPPAPSRPVAAPDRVPVAQAQARRSLAVAGVFTVAAAVTAAVDTGHGRWLPVHLFLAGGVVGAVGGATTLFTVTWSAAPAPSPRTMWVQRILAAVGALGVVAARRHEWPDRFLWASAAVFSLGLICLAIVLAHTVRQGVKRRFDTAVAWYLAAIAAALIGAVIGASYATEGGESGVRSAHVVLNLLGFVGLVVGGTLPTFVATVGRTKMSSRSTDAALRALLVVQVVALVSTVYGLLAGHGSGAAAGLVLYGFGIVVLATRLPLPTKRSLVWAGPRLLALWCGSAWWVASVGAAAVAVERNRLPFADNWTLVIVIAGYGQILWGSLAYLSPVLRGGGHERLGQGFATFRSWSGLVAVNVAGVAWLADSGAVARMAVVLWVLDAVVRGTVFALQGRGDVKASNRSR